MIAEPPNLQSESPPVQARSNIIYLMPASALFFAFILLAAQQTRFQAPGKAAVDEQVWNICPSSPELHGQPETRLWFEGTFAKRAVKLYLDHIGNGVVGVFYSADDWHPVEIGGEWSAKNVLTMGILTDDATEPLRQFGLKGQVADKELVGTWKEDLSGPILPVRLHRVAQPSCDGRGPWRSFSDKRWPIEFSFPASWHLEISDDDITLTCPDPSWMAYLDVNLTMTKVERSDIPLTRCGSRWMFNDEGCGVESSVFASEAKVRTRNRLTQYGGWQLEHRLYCKEGGYKGQGDGEAEALEVGDTWIRVQAEQNATQILPRLNASLKKRP